jgi:hypothetical protein
MVARRVATAPALRAFGSRSNSTRLFPPVSTPTGRRSVLEMGFESVMGSCVCHLSVTGGFIGVQNLDSESFGFPAHRVAKVFPDGGALQTEFDAGLGSQGEDPRGGMIVLVSQTKTLTAYDSDLGR